MGRRPAGEPPKYRRHKTSNLGFSVLDGDTKYFPGPYGSDQSLAEYEAYIAAWRVSHGKVIAKAATRRGTLEAAVQAFLEAHEPPRYSPTEYDDIKRDLDGLTSQWGRISPAALRPQHLRAVRQVWIDAGNYRETVNRRVNRLRRFLRWAVGAELVPPSVLQVIEHMEPLRKGEAPDAHPVEPVPLRDFVKTRKHLPPRIRAMTTIQYYAGPRPAEVGRMRGREIIRSGSIRVGNRRLKIPAGVWLFAPGATKVDRYEDIKIVYCLGPRCQEALTPWLTEDPDAYLFSPRAAADEHHAERRRPDSRYVRVARPRLAPGDCYDTHAYRQVIQRVCAAHDILPWTPAQLRHNFISRMDALSDLVTASAAVGHRTLATTAIYLQSKIHAVGPIAAERG